MAGSSGTSPAPVALPSSKKQNERGTPAAICTVPQSYWTPLRVRCWKSLVLKPTCEAPLMKPFSKLPSPLPRDRTTTKMKAGIWSRP